MGTTRIALAFAAAGAVALGAAAAALPAAAAPTLRFVDLVPVVVRGSSFAPGTSVRVTLVAGNTKLSRAVTSGPGGGFTAGFGTIPKVDRCSGKVVVVAFRVGVPAERAVFRLPALACPDRATDKVVDKTVDKATAGAVDRTVDGAKASTPVPR